MIPPADLGVIAFIIALDSLRIQAYITGTYSYALTILAPFQVERIFGIRRV